MVSDFKSLVDKAAAPTAFQSGHLSAYYEALELDSSQGMTRSNALTAISERIRHSLLDPTGNGQVSFRYFDSLRKALVYEMVIEDKKKRIYLIIMEVMRQALQGNGGCVEVNRWQEAINWALAHIQVSGELTSESIADLRQKEPREVDTAMAIKRLIQRGCEIDWQEGDVKIVAGQDELVNKLIAIISELGGLNVIAYLFKGILVKKYHPFLKRYIFSATIPADFNHIHPSVPYGYILNLAAKCPEDRSQIEDPKRMDDLCKDLIDIATDILKVLDVQPYNQWEKILRRSDNLIDGLYKMAIYEAATTIPQSSPELEMDMLVALFDWVDASTFERATNFSIAEFVYVAKAVLEVARDQIGPVRIYSSKVIKMVAPQKIAKDTVTIILRLMAISKECVNEGYLHITDIDKCNVSKRPLVELSPTKFVLYDKSWCSMGFYETLTDKVKEILDVGKDTKHQHTDRFIGMALERYLFRKYTETGISFHCGKFKDIDQKDAECDTIIEGATAIVIIELKKKQLTARSRAGDMASLFLDLGSSLLHSQLQSGKVELLLKTQGFVDIGNGPDKKRVDWNNREILRVSVTHYDYFGFHDRITAKQILTTFVERTIEPNPDLPTDMLEAYDKLQKHGRDWVAQYQSLAALDAEFADNPFFSSWFLSVGQLLLLLEGVSSNDEFIANLLKTKNMSFSSNNFYYEHLLSDNLDDSRHGIIFITPPRS